MKKRYAAVLFDLDGTLLDTIADLAAAVNHILQKNSCPTHPVSAVSRFVGDGIAKLVERAAPADTPPEVLTRWTAEFASYYQEHMTDASAPYAGVLAMLDALAAADIRLGVVSNKIDSAAAALCRHYFGNRLDVAVGERPNVRRKPAPDTLLAALQTLGVPPEAAVYVGDAETDIAAARAAGIPCISVTWGNRDRAFLAACGGTQFADTPAELLTYLTEEV